MIGKHKNRLGHGVFSRVLGLGVLFVAFIFQSCGLNPPNDSLMLADEVPYDGQIRLSLAHPYEAAKDDYELLFAVDEQALKMGVCLADTVDCLPGKSGFFPASLIHSAGQRRFFKTESSALLEDGLVLKIVAVDKSGQAYDTRIVRFYGGGEVSVPTDPTQTPSTPTTTPTTPTTTVGAGDNPFGPDPFGNTGSSGQSGQNNTGGGGGFGGGW